MDWLVTLFEKFFPPMTAIQTWRVMMGLVALFVCFHILWAANFIPGLDGFAQTNQITQIKNDVQTLGEENKKAIAQINQTQNVILARLIASDIEAARASQCRALAERNSSGAQGWRVRLDSALYEYRLTAGRDYNLRPCDEY